MTGADLTKRTVCRLCDSPNLEMVLPLKASPVADNFLSHEHKNEEQKLYPLDLYQCQSCGHAQNIDVVNPEILFRDYIFHTSSSAGLVNHFREYAKHIVEKFDLKPDSLILEIGSNDGTLLKFFKELGMRVVGVDPAVGIAKEATEFGVPTLAEFFTSDLAAKIKQQHGAAKLVVANNVYAHSDHLADMTDAVQLLLDDDGVFVFEVSYLLDIVDKFLFDTIYHEHVSYHSIKPFKQFFAKHGLHFFDLERVGTKGGSMRGFVQRSEAKRIETPVIQEMIDNENKRGLDKPAIFEQYSAEIEKRKTALLEYVIQAKKQGKRVVAYGASTTVMTLMYHFELTDQIEYLVDDNQMKHGMFAPGCHLEVKPSTVLYEDKPDVVIVLAWQYSKPICSKHQEFVKNGGVFVVPLIDLNVIDQPEACAA